MSRECTLMAYKENYIEKHKILSSLMLMFKENVKETKETFQSGEWNSSVGTKNL